MSTHQDINALRAQRIANTHDPLALMANTQTLFHPDHSSLITDIQHPQPNNNFVVQPSFNMNYLQHPMQNPGDILNPTTAFDMALVLMAKAFTLNDTTPTNNNQRSSSNPSNMQIAQPGMHMDQDRQMLMVEDNVGNQFRPNAMQNVKNQVVLNASQNSGVQNVRNQNGLSVVPGIANQHGNGNVVVARAEGAYDEIEKVTANCNLQDNLQQASTSGTQSDKALVYDSDGSAENDSNVISAVSIMEQSRGTVEQHPETVEEPHAYFESLYNYLAIEVEKVNMVNRKLRETNADLTTEPARYKNQEKCFEISQEKYDKLESSGKQITTLNEEISNLNKRLSKEKSTISSLLEEKKRLKSDFKIRKDELLDKQIQLEKKIKELDNILVKMAVVSQDIMSIVQNPSVVDSSNLQTELERTKELFENCIIKKKNEYAKLWNDWYKKCEECKYDKISYDKAYNDMQQKIKRLQAQLGDQKGKSKDTPYVSNTLDPSSQKLKNENLRAQLFDKVSEQKGTNKGTSVNTKFANQSILEKPPSSSRPKLYVVTPLPKSMAFPKVGEANALINPFKDSRVDNFMPNKHVKASVRTKPITVSQPLIITKNDVNSKTNGFSPKDVISTARTKRPQPRNNPQSEKVPFKSKSSCLSNKLEKIEENHRILQSSNYPDHTSSECNNIKLAIRNEKSEVICATCKQCLITANHDECVLQYVNGMKYTKKNQSANVSKSANQKTHNLRVWKPKKLGSNERLASPNLSKPRSCLRWSPSGRLFELNGKIITTTESVCQSDYSKCDNACTSNPQEPISKRFPNSTFSMTGCQNWLDTLLIPLLSEYKPKDKEDHGDNECDT
ncbi:hypothetical protein Tco_0733082 [Tanacetum coccineum]